MKAPNTKREGKSVSKCCKLNSKCESDNTQHHKGRFKPEIRIGKLSKMAEKVFETI